MLVAPERPAHRRHLRPGSRQAPSKGRPRLWQQRRGAEGQLQSHKSSTSPISYSPINAIEKPVLRTTPSTQTLSQARTQQTAGHVRERYRRRAQGRVKTTGPRWASTSCAGDWARTHQSPRSLPPKSNKTTPKKECCILRSKMPRRKKAARFRHGHVPAQGSRFNVSTEILS